MPSYLFQFLNGHSEFIGADRVEYDSDECIFRAVCDTEGVVFLAPADNVLCVRKSPQSEAMAGDLWLGQDKLNAAVTDALARQSIGRRS